MKDRLLITTLYNASILASVGIGTIIYQFSGILGITVAIIIYIKLIKYMLDSSN